MAGVFVSSEKLAELLAGKAEWSARETVIEALQALTVDPNAVAVADSTLTDASTTYVEAEIQELADNVAAIIAGLKTLGIFVDP